MILKNNRYILIILSLLTFCTVSISGQTPQIQQQMPELSLPTMSFPAGKNVVEMPFEANGNQIVTPVSINGSRPLRFVFDTGLSGVVLYNSTIVDSLNLKITGTMQMRGAGGGGAGFEVKVAENASFNIGGIEFSNGHLSLIPSPRAYDGVIGRPIFATTVVEIDWENKVVRFYEPAKYKYSGSGSILPLTFDEGGRPYTTAAVAIEGEKIIPVKLVVDTGGSHALSLEPGSNAEIKPPAGAAKTSLGRGASGEITGYTGRVKNFQLGNYSVKDVPTGFPDASGGTAGTGGRNGNLGGGVLRRFKVVFDYSRKQLIVEPNKFINEAFGTPMPNNVAANTVQIPPAALQDYTGRYGERAITSESGALYIQRPGGPKLKLVAVAAKAEFTLEVVPAARIKIIRDEANKVTEIQVLNREGQWENSKKEQPNNEPLSSNQPNNQSEQSLKQSAVDAQTKEQLKNIMAYLRGCRASQKEEQFILHL